MNFQIFTSKFTLSVLYPTIKIVLILITAYFTNRSFKIFLKKAIKKQIKDKISSEEKRKRIKTLFSVFSGTLKFIIWTIALLMILSELGVNITPILANVGVLGLAVSMAARDVISDFISGLFIILEDQYRVGDKLKIGEIEGVVEEITLRRTIIKDEKGFFHLIPNSQIKLVSKKIE